MALSLASTNKFFMYVEYSTVAVMGLSQLGGYEYI